MSPAPRSLILNLLLGTETRGEASLSVRELLAACAVFGLAGNSVRVALARGVAAGLLKVPRRGHYGLGPAARPLADEVNRWRALVGKLTDWSGDWIAVHVGATGRSDRAALRARERAFGLLGLAEFERGLHLRPDNLAGGIGALRARLAALLPAGADHGTVFIARDLGTTDAARAADLWDGAALDDGYRDTAARLTAWIDGSHTLSLERAAREVFGLGHEAIRRVVFDPLLPAPLVDVDARSRFVAAVVRIDDLGREIWQRFLAAARSETTSRIASHIEETTA